MSEEENLDMHRYERKTFLLYQKKKEFEEYYNRNKNHLS